MNRSSDSTGNKDQLFGRSRRLQVQARVIRSRAVRARGDVKKREAAAPGRRLSARESEVLGLVSHGLSTKNLAIQLGISTNTANYHLSNIYRKLGAHNRVEAANEYFRRKPRA